jgi:rubrerythrin
MSATLEQAIKTAIEYENKVHAVYREAQEQATDPIGRRIFATLAREEQGHIAYLEHCLSEWQRTGELVAPALETAIPSTDKIAHGLERMRQRVEGKQAGATAETELLQRAIEAEDVTSSFYRKMVAELDAQGQQLFARFVEIEEGHLAIVRAEMDAVTGLGYWFDMPEWQFQE